MNPIDAILAGLAFVSIMSFVWMFGEFVALGRATNELVKSANEISAKLKHESIKDSGHKASRN